jgi:hypothetical protein
MEVLEAKFVSMTFHVPPRRGQVHCWLTRESGQPPQCSLGDCTGCAHTAWVLEGLSLGIARRAYMVVVDGKFLYPNSAARVLFAPLTAEAVAEVVAVSRCDVKEAAESDAEDDYRFVQCLHMC